MKSRLASAVLVAVVLTVSPQAAYAASDTVDPAVDAAPVVTSFSVMGTGIVLTVEMDPAGHLTSVELLNDAGTAPTDVSRHRCRHTG